MQLFLTIIYRSKHIVFVSIPDDSLVADVKAYITRATDIPEDAQNLSFNGALLDDYHTLCECCLPRNAGLTLTLPPGQAFRYKIYVRIPGVRDPVKLRIGLGTCLWQVRRGIEAAMEIPVDQQTLVFRGWVLGTNRDDRTLAELGVRSDDIIRLFFSDGNGKRASAMGYRIARTF